MALIVQIVVDIILAWIAAVALPALTLGRVRMMRDDMAAQMPAAERRWHGVHRHPSGTIYLDEAAAITVVVFLVVSVLVASLALTR